MVLFVTMAWSLGSNRVHAPACTQRVCPCVQCNLLFGARLQAREQYGKTVLRHGCNVLCFGL